VETFSGLLIVDHYLVCLEYLVLVAHFRDGGKRGIDAPLEVAEVDGVGVVALELLDQVLGVLEKNVGVYH